MINYFTLIAANFKSSTLDDFGMVMLLLAPVLLVVAFLFLIAGFVKKDIKPKMFKSALISFIAAGISALVGIGTCGWFG